MDVLESKEVKIKIMANFKLYIIFAWYDFWIGLFWDKKKRHLYIFPIPMVGLLIKFGNYEKL